MSSTPTRDPCPPKTVIPKFPRTTAHTESKSHVFSVSLFLLWAAEESAAQAWGPVEKRQAGALLRWEHKPMCLPEQELREEQVLPSKDLSYL